MRRVVGWEESVVREQLAEADGRRTPGLLVDVACSVTHFRALICFCHYKTIVKHLLM